MRMIRPKIVAPQVTIAENQDDYRPVTAALVVNALYPHVEGHHNTVVLCYLPSKEDLQALINGEPIYLHMLTFGGKLQPHIISVGTENVAAMYGVEVET